MQLFHYLASGCNKLIFFEIYSFPAIIILLILSCLLCSIGVGSRVIKLMKHGFKILFANDKQSSRAIGDIRPFQALSVALSGTVGVGNIAGTALAISIGGIGSLFWILMSGILGMYLKFFEVTLSQETRLHGNGELIGGSFLYIKEAFSKIGLKNIGVFVSSIYAVFALLAILFGGNVLQINQMASMAKVNCSFIAENQIYLGVFLSISFSFFFFRNVKFLGLFLSLLLPATTLLFLSSSFCVVFLNIELLPSVIKTMFTEAFSFRSTFSSLPAIISIGLQRGFFANMAGTGISTIVHSAAKSQNPIDQGCVSMLEPLLDTTFICFIVGIAVATGLQGHIDIDLAMEMGGVAIAWQAYSITKFTTVALYICVFFFGTSVVISSGYIFRTIWRYIFADKLKYFAGIIMSIAVYFGSVANCLSVFKCADFFLFSLMVPNILSIFILRKSVAKHIDQMIEEK